MLRFRFELFDHSCRCCSQTSSTEPIRQRGKQVVSFLSYVPVTSFRLVDVLTSTFDSREVTRSIASETLGSSFGWVNATSQATCRLASKKKRPHTFDAAAQASFCTESNNGTQDHISSAGVDAKNLRKLNGDEATAKLFTVAAVLPSTMLLIVVVPAVPPEVPGVVVPVPNDSGRLMV